MRRVAAIVTQGTWPAAEATATVTLDYDTRCRRRIRIDADDGEAVLLERAEAGVLGDGDGLQLDDGRWLLVRAQPEALAAVDATDTHHLLRLAWHLGNRHLPTEIDGETLYIHRDHVIEAMLRGLGAEVRPVTRPFNPEGGAYDSHSRHGHAAQSGHAHHHHPHDGGAPIRANGKDPGP
jgi:urease accessory protein